MKKRSSTLLFFGLAVFWFLFSGFPNNPPNGRTGAPGDGNCTNCHNNSNPNGFDGEINLTGIPATITPNTTYVITVSVSNPNSLANRAGFQWVALNENNTNAGNMANPSSSSTVTPASGRIYHEHNPAVSFPGSNEITWTVDWTSPAATTNDQTITLYGAAVIGNGSNSSGDFVVNTNTSAILPGAGGGDPLATQITNVQQVSCNGGNDGQATVNATGGEMPYTYSWSNGNTNATATNLSAGINSVTVTDHIGATSTASISISQPSEIGINITNQSDVNCISNSGSATAIAFGGTPGYSYAWSSGEFGPTANNLAPGTNTVSVTDANNCLQTQTVNIAFDDTPPAVDAGTNATLNCLVTSVTLMGTTPGCSNCSFSWTTDDGNIVSGNNTPNPEVNAPGTYLLSVTNNDNGCSATDVVIIDQDINIPNPDAGPAQTLTCNLSSVTLSGSAGNCNNCSFAWTTSDGNILSGANTPNPEVNQAGTYTLSVTDNSNGCSNSSQVTVTENIPVSVLIDITSSISCNGASDASLAAITTNGATPFTYAWSTGDNTPTINNLAAGFYSLTVTDNDGCEAIASLSISQPVQLEANASSTNETAAGANDGTASVDPIGGTTDYTINWSNGASTSTISNLTPDTYFVTVTDANGCEVTESVTVNSFDCLIAATITSTDVSCNGDSDGQATVTVENAAEPITYAWSSGGNQATEMGLSAGTYTVSVTDANNCPTTANVTISEPELLQIEITGTNETSNDANDGTAAATPSGGTPPYTYEWNTSDNTAMIENLAPGTYSLTLTDSFGCTASQSISINAFDCEAIFIEFSGQNIICPGASDGSIQIDTVLNAVAPFSYNWSNGSDASFIDGLSEGLYSVEITDANNCVFTREFVILEEDNEAPIALATDITVQIGMDGSAIISPEDVNNGSSDNCSIDSLALSQSSFDCSMVGENMVILTVFDQAGNSRQAMATVTVETTLQVAVVTTDITCAGANDGTVNITVTGGVPPYTFDGFGDNLPPGTFTGTTTDAVGCSVVVSFTINEPEPIVVTIDEIIPENGDEMNGTVNISVEGGVGDYCFEWFLGNELVSTEEDPNNLAAGTYLLLVHDNNGCQVQQEVTIDRITSTIDTELDASIDLFPNPTNGQFVLNINPTIASDFLVEIYNSNGQKILTEEKIKSSNYLREFDLSNFAAGIYWIKISNQEKVAIKKLMLTR